MRFTRPHQEENHFARRVLGNFKAAAWHWRSWRLLVSFNAAEPSSEAHRPQSCRPRALIAMWFEVCGPSEVSLGKNAATRALPDGQPYPGPMLDRRGEHLPRLVEVA